MISYQSTATQTITINNRLVPFNTVDLDNARMVNLALRADRINLTRTGIWSIGALITGTTGQSGTYPSMLLANTGVTPNQTFIDGNRDSAPTDGETYQATGLAFVTSTTGWIDYRLNVPTPITVSTAAMWAFWTADR